MAITGTKIFTCNHGDTYANIEEWIDVHGKCGTKEEELESATLTLNPDGQSVTATYVWLDEEQREAWKEGRASFTRNYTTAEKSELSST